MATALGLPMRAFRPQAANVVIDRITQATTSAACTISTSANCQNDFLSKCALRLAVCFLFLLFLMQSDNKKHSTHDSGATKG